LGDQPVTKTAAEINALGGPGVPVGTILDFAGNSVPAKFLSCYGQAVSRATYPDLFLAIGVLWGPGDGSTTFNVPYLPRTTCIGDSGVPTPLIGATVGSLGGAEAHTLTEAEMPAHVHDTPIAAQTLTGGPTAGLQWSQGAFGGFFTDSRGGNTPHSNFQPSAVVKKIIRALP